MVVGGRMGGGKSGEGERATLREAEGSGDASKRVEVWRTLREAEGGGRGGANLTRSRRR